MFRTGVRALAALTIGLVSACNPTGDPNGLTPKDWNQLQSDAMGTGFNAVHSIAPVADNKKWSAVVGQMAFSSPVISKFGGVFVGTTSGDLVAVAPDGTIPFRRNLDECIISSPAIADGESPSIASSRIYVITQHRSGDSFASTLQMVDGSNVTRMPDILGFKTTASPKLWGDFVFVPSGNRLYAFNQSDLSEFAHADGCSGVVCGSARIDPRSTAPPTADQIISCIVKTRSSNLLDIKNCAPTFDPNLINGPVIAPSVAIIDAPTLVNPNTPTILMATALCLNSFRFDPKLGQGQLQLLWSQPLVPMDCDNFRVAYPTSPAVVYINGGMILLGISYDDDRRNVMAFNINDGSVLWNYSSGDMGVIEAPPAGGLRQIYTATSNSLFVIDDNGLFDSRTPSITPLAGAALSLERVYYPTENGIASMSVDPANPDNTFENSIANTTNFGRAVPAIGRDGTLYVAMPNGKLTAYATGTAAP